VHDGPAGREESRPRKGEQTVTEEQITKAIVAHIDDAMEYSRQLERFVLDDVLTQEQEARARDVIHDEAVLGITAPALEHARALKALDQLLETGWGSEADDADEEE
jgi:hypothetical protein